MRATCRREWTILDALLLALVPSGTFWNLTEFSGKVSDNRLLRHPHLTSVPTTFPRATYSHPELQTALLLYTTHPTPIMDNFTDKSSEVIKASFDKAAEMANSQVSPLHLISVLWDEPTGADAGGSSTGAAQPTLLKSSLERMGGNPQAFNRTLMSKLNKLPVVDPAPDPPLPLTQSFHAVLRAAQKLQKEQNDQFVAVDHLILALLQVDTAELKDLLKVAGTTAKALEDEVRRKRGGRKVDSRGAESQFDALNKYCVDLTALAEQGKLDPVIGRDNEIRRVIRVLSRRTKGNPVLIGKSIF